MNNSFRSFLNDVKERLFPDESATVLEPESPPNWKRLGWKTGWIVEEGHTGLQWWVTDEHQWDPLAEPFGQTKRQRNQTFSRWYKSLLDEYRRRLGVPLKLESVRWRQMDMGAFEGRPLIEDEDWWCVGFEGTRGGRWDLILSERFIQLFEEETERSPTPEPPWSFLELWESIDSNQRQELLAQGGTDSGFLNHLSALVLAGSLTLDNLRNLMPRQPFEQLQDALENRRDKLADLTDDQERQTLDAWKKDAVNNLTDRVGQWLLEQNLSGEDWSGYREEWSGYRVNVLEGTFDDDSWAALWTNFDPGDIERLVPRLNREELIVSLVGIKESIRGSFEEALPRRQVEMIFDEPPAYRNHLDVLKARESIYGQIRETIADIDYDLAGDLSLEE